MREMFDEPSTSQPGDERLYVKFYMGSTPDTAGTQREGRPMFKSVPFVKILVPGDRNTVIDTFADAKYKARFPRQWAAFESKQTQEVAGTLLSETPLVTRAQAEEFDYFKVFTVEQLAQCSDNLASKVPRFHELKRAAQTYVAQAKDGALAQKLGAENADLKNRVASLEGEIARLSTMFEAATKPQVEMPRVEQSRSRNRSAVV
jgi:hypothetical protein